MERLSKEPYSNPDLVKIYEQRYTTHPTQASDITFEIKAIEQLMEFYQYNSWCDVACGTAYHLRKAYGDFSRQGVDRSKLMVNQHKEDTNYSVDYSITNLLSWRTKKKFDLVTNFWFGYAHQPSLEKVIKFFEKMVDLTAKDGTIIISIHNHWKLFDEIPRFTTDVDSQFNFDALQWSYVEPSTGDVYKCISPHKDLIIETFAPYFEHYTVTEYPRVSAKELLIFRGKNNG